jgi:putative endonuclease
MVPSKSRKGRIEGPEMPDVEAAWFYILRLQSGALYLGATTNLPARYKDHISGKASRTTALDPPTSIVFSELYHTFKEARRREAQVKRWSRAKKEALVLEDLHELRKLS